jgi:hypothetical protein
VIGGRGPHDPQDIGTGLVDATTDPTGPQAVQDEPLAALVAELQDFVRGVSLPGRLSLVGAMLQETADPAVVQRYRDRVIAPRRQRILGILRTARQRGLIDPDADLDVVVTGLARPRRRAGVARGRRPVAERRRRFCPVEVGATPWTVSPAPDPEARRCRTPTCTSSGTANRTRRRTTPRTAACHRAAATRRRGWVDG